MLKKTSGWLIPLLLFLAPAAGVGQGGGAADTTQTTTQSTRSIRKIDIFPAISYSPETKLTLGVIGYYNLDLYRGDPTTKFSNINFLAVYTLANQIAVESQWDIFTDGNRWRFRGRAFYNRWPDRNYGRGNDASTLVAETSEDGQIDTVNYLRFDSDRVRFAPIVLRELRPHLYLGLQAEVETLYRLRTLPDAYAFLNADSTAITELPVDGLRSGIGLQLLYDTRDYVLNPLRGTFVELNNLHFVKWLGSDFVFHSFRLDARQYINPVLNHTLALRGVANFRFSDDPIPLRGLSRVGGREFIRGYFQGTYQDNHLAAFELEYRLPLWREGSESKLWQVWKRLGLVGFVSGAQVFPNMGDFDFGRFNMAVGGGLRILFNEKTRVNLRIDYAVALRPDSDGPAGRQSGLYFYLAEAF